MRMRAGDPGSGEPVPAKAGRAGAGALAGLAANDNGPGGNGVLTPWGGFALAEGGARRFGHGTRLELAPAFRLAVEGQRRNANAGPEHTIMLRGSLRW